MIRLSFTGAIRALLLACALAVAASAAASTGVSIDGLLGGLRTKGEATLALGREPTRCLSLPRSGAATTELCEWRLGNRDAAWETLASALASDARIGVICAFDIATSERSEGTSCTARARRSNRDAMRNRGGYRKDKARRRADQERRAKTRAAGVAALDAARQLEALTHELGELPVTCEPVLEDVVCVWRTNGRTPGHGTVVASIAGDMTKKARFTCRLPADGSDRRPGSCSAVIGN